MHLPWEEIEKLTKYLEDKGLAEVSIETKDGKISLKKGGFSLPYTPSFHSQENTPQVISEKVDIKKSNHVEIISPMVGTFYAASSPQAEPFVKVGSKVKPGDVLCIIEAMKIMNELPSEVTGTVKEILVKDGQTVEYGQVVIRVEP